MSYNFKKLSEVELATESKETDTVLIVQDGKVKQTDKVKGGGGSAMILTPEDFVEFSFSIGSGGQASLTREKFNEFAEAFPLVALAIPASYISSEDSDGVLKLGLSSGVVMQAPGDEEGFTMETVLGSFEIRIAE